VCAGISLSRIHRVFVILVLLSTLIYGFKPAGQRTHLPGKWQQEEKDSIIWRTAIQFTILFNKGDTAAMNQFLPEDFMLQWLHENFLGKKDLLNAMRDTAVLSTLRHILHRDAQTIIHYSDNGYAAGLNATIGFLDQVMVQSIKKEHGYGLTSMYFQKREGRWRLTNVHLDLHCSLCNV
jgi:hypothetical protein